MNGDGERKDSEFDEITLQSRLELIRQKVAQPIPKQPWNDDLPAVIPFHDSNNDGDDETNQEYNSTTAHHLSKKEGGGILIGNARHASNIPLLKSLNVTAVLNCASGGIARLPVDELRECGIHYTFTNCQDSWTYPILHHKSKRRHSSESIDELSEAPIICSHHLQVSNELFTDMRKQIGAFSVGKSQQPIGNALFFCVAGQNRSAALATATMMLHGKTLEEILSHFARQRPFVLENVGFQRQIVELESILRKLKSKSVSDRLPAKYITHFKQLLYANDGKQYKRFRMIEESLRTHEKQTPLIDTSQPRIKSENDGITDKRVEIELLIPGLCTMEVRVPNECTIKEVKKYLIKYVNHNLLRYGDNPAKVAKAWLVLAMFGYDDMYDIPLEIEAVELKVQLERIQCMFGLSYEMKNGEPIVQWNEKCRFALVIFSVVRLEKVVSNDSPSVNCSNEAYVDTYIDPYETNFNCQDKYEDNIDQSLREDQVPWTFEHQERLGAPATLLENTLRSTHLRAWDFVTGESLASKLPIVFSYSDDPRDRRSFMMVSRSANTLQQFLAPGEGDILGMGENAIVHRVQLRFTQADGRHRDDGWTPVNVGLKNGKFGNEQLKKEEIKEEKVQQEEWDAAVKRPFSLGKMLIFLQNSSEAGLAKRLRLANLLNSDRRVLYFYGLGLGLSTNAYNQNQYKFELMLLAQYDEAFSTYTMRQFMEEYMTVISTVTEDHKRASIEKLHSEFSIMSVKVLLVSLLNAFRDLTLMGVQAFDFNHLNNVLVSRDFKTVKLIDIDGNMQGSIAYPKIETTSKSFVPSSPKPLEKPCLNVDLNILLPSVIEQLMLGKGRGRSFVSNIRSEIWRAKEEDGKKIIEKILLEIFYPDITIDANDDVLSSKVYQHTTKVTEWFYAVMKKQSPWNTWTLDIYDAMRCIDHLPIR